LLLVTALQPTAVHSLHVYEVRPRKDHRGVAAISDALPFIIALIVGGVLVFTAIAAAVIVKLFSRRPK
jgi:hypothetical protein